jgi:hypothetical protein
VVERALEPKVQGALVLNTLFKEEPLDFFVLFSSLTSILGGAGQVDYCGANAFLDAFAHHFEPKDWKRLVSVNWDTWQEVGMAVKTDVPHSLKAWRQETLKLGILPIEGTDAFARFLHISAPQIAVTPRDIGELLNSHHPQPTLPALDKQQETAASTAQHPRPELDSPYVAPRNPLEQELAAIWQEILGVGRLGT